MLTVPSPHSINPLSLHDALPISIHAGVRRRVQLARIVVGAVDADVAAHAVAGEHIAAAVGGGAIEAAGRRRGCGEAVLRSEEHTSELQSQSNLVCRLLLEKKKTC